MIEQFHFWEYTPQIESMVLKRYLCTHVKSNIIHNSQKLETIQVFINR